VVSGLKTNLANCIERCERDERELDTLQQRVEEYSEAININRQQLAGEQESHKNLLVSREQLLGRIEKEDEAYQKLIEREKKLEAAIDANKAQLKFLEGLDASFEGYEAGVKALLTQRKSDILGIIADLIKVGDESTASLVERVLGTSIQTVVFKTEAQLENAMAFLTKEKTGSASMLSLERLQKTAACPKAAVSGAVSLRGAVQSSDECAAMADRILGNIWVTDTTQAAMDLSVANPTGIFISKEGVVCYDNGTIVAGVSKKQQAGLLQRKRQIDKLAIDIEVFRVEYEKVIHEKEICIINRDEAKFALVEVDEKLNRGRQKQQEQETTIKHYETEIRNILFKTENITVQCAQTRQRIGEMDRGITEGEAALEALVVRKTHVEELVEQSKAGLLELQKERNGHAEHLKNIELEMMGLTNRIQQEKSEVERLAGNAKNFSAKKEKVIEEKRRAHKDITDTDASMASKIESLAVEKDRRTKLEQIRDKVREEYNGMQLQLDEVRKELRSDQVKHEEISNTFHAHEIDQTRDEQEKRRIRERIWQAYEIDLEAPPEGLPVIDDEDASVMENINMFKERLKRLGEVNMAALADFETENSRLTELTTQRNDLQTAVDDLDKAIKKLDREARTQFLATFEQVQKNFVTMFTTLFEGGEAHVTLEENIDPLEAAIHINVRPGGKKMRGVGLLSGGERALTAISLLFALYLVKPSAYCILDELDAPLDDANIGRFVNILRKFSEQTQFIVVTHNKRTMEAADLLYGVTQQESGISTIVSVKVEEAALQAA
jgi:chromosome segregation protein